MRSLTAFVFLIFFTNAWSQKCHYLINKVSGMDSSRLVITEPVNLSKDFGVGSVDVWSTIYGDTSLVLAFVFNVKENFPVKQGDRIYINFMDGEEMVLEIFQKPVLKSEGKEKLLTTLTSVEGSALEALRNQQVRGISVHFGNAVVGGTTLKKNQTTAIQTTVNCVIEYLH
ncbi:MAG: hypothetical protein PVF73_07245 [Bacteroidales bacterium]|jgi:hypothetical protein